MRSVIRKTSSLGLLVLAVSVATFGQAATTELIGDFSNMTVGTVRAFNAVAIGGSWNFPDHITIGDCKPNATADCWNEPDGLGFSLNANGPFTHLLTNVPLPLDYWGSGTSQTIYMKALTSAAAVRVLGCTATAGGGETNYFSISGSGQTPANPNPPPGVSAIGVGEIVPYWLVTPQQVAPEFRGYTVTFSVRPTEEIGASRNSSSTTWLASFAVDMYIDQNGYGRSETFYLKGREKTNGTAYIQAQTDNHFIAQSQNIPMKVAQVTTVTWVPYRSTHALDSNPNTGGGARHYADKNTVNESPDTEWRQIGLKVQANPAVAGMTIRVKVLDVDDPSNDTNLDPNGIAGNDNREAGGTFIANLTTDATGSAFVYRRVSSRPGDNYRAAAMITSSPLPTSNALRQRFDAITTSSTNGILLKDGTSTLPEWNPVSPVSPIEEFLSGPMLTIWRRLHIEHDSMGQVSHNRATGSFLRMQRFKPATHTLLDLDTSSPRLETHRYQNGRLVLKETVASTPRIFRVLWNTDSQVQVEGDIAIANFSNDTFTLYDDDDFNNNDGTSPDGDDGEEIPDIFSDLVRDSDFASHNALAPAYITPKYDMPGNQSNLQFRANEITSTANFDNIAHVSDQDLWLLYFINTYQTGSRADGDPDSAGAQAGLRFGGIGMGFYLEGYRELERREIEAGRIIPPHATMKRWLAQEIGMLLGTESSDGGMAASVYECTSGCTSFTPKSQARMRSVLLPVNLLD